MPDTQWPRFRTTADALQLQIAQQRRDLALATCPHEIAMLERLIAEREQDLIPPPGWSPPGQERTVQDG